MEIELKDSLNKAITNGVNLFLGAGFSIYSKDIKGNNLPLGNKLSEELISKFKCPPINDLSKVCTIIDSTDSIGLKNFLVNRFSINEYDSRYESILKINSPRIFTTNIDNLIYKIFEKSNKKYINNIFTDGFCYNDSTCIDYIPLHGCVEDIESKFLFNKQEISSSFRTQKNGWTSLTNAASQLPSIFIGYSLEDVGAIESLFGENTSISTQKEKWILLYKKDEGTEAYFKALGFNIIIGDTLSFLDYINKIPLKSEKTINEFKDSLHLIFEQEYVKKANQNNRVRQIDEFFLGSPPIWSDIQFNRIYSTSHLSKILNLVESKKNIIITGIPASGKSTLKLQIANSLKKEHRVFMFENISFNKSEIIKKEVKQKTIILVDNYTTDTESFLNISQNPHIKLIGFDRYFYVDMSSHRLSKDDFNFYDVSDLNDKDIQSIYNSIPQSIRKPNLTKKTKVNEVPSIFEIVNYNINKPALSDRYREVLDELNQDDPDLLDLLLLTSYLHSCRVPLSFEVANSFLDNDYQYYEVIEMINSLKGMVNEAIGNVIFEKSEEQDYYEPRSQVLAETIISQSKYEYFKRMFSKFHTNVPKHQIPNFKTFKRKAYDSFYVNKSYHKWDEGLDFYEEAYFKDKSPFLLQQSAIYLMQKKRFTEAAIQIDKALQSSYKRFFTIENTHAIILFKANINSIDSNSSVRNTLDKSMEILKKCYLEDKRKTYHAITFAEQSISYHIKYPDETSKEYLSIAKGWLNEIEVEKRWNRKSKELLRELTLIV
ncbi:hypothetical protein BXQ17_08050 [Polaribacter sp. BM10]|uniref:SIR2 family protein n=1 Tax=Polaribacter sp. BM10 TaxID=1529069 RepID=UPI00098AC790|nr:SIR2 family protein [Polaribacter sp. BM10]AQS94018.1 hypothetical protein BXQ17_08050 [Polaribacter sp. BM10]